MVHRTKAGRWLPIPHNLTVHVHPGEAAYASQPLAYAWNELLDLLSAEPRIPAPTGSLPDDTMDGWVEWMYAQRAPIALHVR